MKKSKDSWYERVGMFLFILVVAIGLFMAGHKIGGDLALEEHECPKTINIMEHEGPIKSK